MRSPPATYTEKRYPLQTVQRATNLNAIPAMGVGQLTAIDAIKIFLQGRWRDRAVLLLYSSLGDKIFVDLSEVSLAFFKRSVLI
jgi:hypothetical protein